MREGKITRTLSPENALVYDNLLWSTNFRVGSGHFFCYLFSKCLKQGRKAQGDRELLFVDLRRILSTETEGSLKRHRRPHSALT